MARRQVLVAYNAQVRQLPGDLQHRECALIAIGRQHARNFDVGHHPSGNSAARVLAELRKLAAKGASPGDSQTATPVKSELDRIRKHRASRLAGAQVGSDGTDRRWRIARKMTPERVISTVDPEARHTRKSPSSRRDGYRAHLVAEPETRLITDEALTKTAGAGNADAALARQFVAHTEPDHTPAAAKDAEHAANADVAQVGGGAAVGKMRN